MNRVACMDRRHEIEETLGMDAPQQQYERLEKMWYGLFVFLIVIYSLMFTYYIYSVVIAHYLIEY